MALSPLSPLGESEETGNFIVVQPLKTYAINFETGDLAGTVDGAESIRQFVIKTILTARYRFPIYDFDYGSELESLIGQDASPSLLLSEIPRVVSEALIYDERINNVYGFQINQDSDKLFVSFFVSTDSEVIPVEVTL